MDLNQAEGVSKTRSEGILSPGGLPTPPVLPPFGGQVAGKGGRLEAAPDHEREEEEDFVQRPS